MLKLGWCKIKRINKSQKNWLIYGDIDKEDRIKIYIQDYKNKGEMIMTFNNPFLMDDGYCGVVTSKDTKAVEQLLEEVKRFLSFLSPRYKLLRWFINKDELNKLLISHRLISSG